VSRGREGAPRREAGRSRERLLAAAGELFAERGYDHSTIRDIGARAGLDPALIARYFGGKTQLYLAALRAEQGDGEPADLLEADRLREAVERIDRRGLVPLLQVAVHQLPEQEAQADAEQALRARMVAPLVRRFTEEGARQPELRAEAVAAAVVGILLARSSPAFPELGRATPEELVPLLLEVLGGAGC
jgi:AcrR family transcriptional regulator